MICRLPIAATLVAFLASTRDSQSQPVTTDAPRQDGHALLVGVTLYENLPKSKHLLGPANDVLLMRTLLVEKFRFSPERIVVLSEQEGKERGKDFLPTRANIERAFKRLARVAKAGEQVVIHMGGHGSQQPENKHSPDPEPDGLDEIFLPRDVGAWDGAKGTIANAIIDDELGAWLKAIRDRKASVWITFDSCHSGTMIRGGDDREVPRDLNPVKDLGIPQQTIKEARALANKRNADSPARTRGGDPTPAFKLAKEGGIVAIYACQPDEVTYERELPPMSKEAKIYGLLTYTLCKVLTEAAEKSKEPITYNELARRIYAQYAQWGSRPTPAIEGVDRDRQVLGDKVWLGRSSIVLAKGANGFKINAGALHGLTSASILAVMPPPGTGDEVRGHVRIKHLGIHASDVEPTAFDKARLVKELPAGGACKVVVLGVGDMRLNVAVDSRDADNQHVAESVRTNLEKTVKGLAGPQSLLRAASNTSQADWLVRVQGDTVVLVPGAGWSDGRAPLGNVAFGPAPIDDGLGKWLETRLAHIARGESLKRIAAGEGSQDNSVRLDLKVLRKKSDADKLGSIPVDWPAPEITAYDQDRLVFHVTNKSQFPIDVTLLYVDSGYGIDCLFPRRAEDNRLHSGERISPPLSLRFNSKTFGREYVVVIAVKGSGLTVDFSQLVQPTLERALEKAGTRGEQLKQSLDTPLGRLLKHGMYGERQSRSLTFEEMGDYGLMLVPLAVRSQKRPGTSR